jgi:putative exporter of polyketide antibiotics
MDVPIRNGADRWLIVAATVAVALVIGGIAYEYSDDLTAFAQSLTGEKLGRPQGRLHY